MYAAKLMRDFEAFRTCMAMDSAEVRQSDLPKHVSPSVRLLSVVFVLVCV